MGSSDTKAAPMINFSITKSRKTNVNFIMFGVRKKVIYTSLTMGHPHKGILLMHALTTRTKLGDEGFKGFLKDLHQLLTIFSVQERSSPTTSSDTLPPKSESNQLNLWKILIVLNLHYGIFRVREKDKTPVFCIDF